MDQFYVASLMIVSKEMEPDIYVFGSGVYDRVLCNANSGHVVYKDGNHTKTQSIILHGLFHPKYLGVAATISEKFTYTKARAYHTIIHPLDWRD